MFVKNLSKQYDVRYAEIIIKPKETINVDTVTAVKIKEMYGRFVSVFNATEAPKADKVEEELKADKIVLEEPTILDEPGVQADKVEEEPKADKVEEEPKADKVEEEPKADKVEEEPKADKVEEEQPKQPKTTPKATTKKQNKTSKRANKK